MRFAAPLITPFLLLIPVFFVSPAVSGPIDPLSIGSDGNFGNAPSMTPAIGSVGNLAAFESKADNLVPGDANGVQDIFVRNRASGKIERVSIGSSGNEANGPSRLPSFSSDGRFVAFASSASNLVPDDTNATEDIFVHDLLTGLTELVSVNSQGEQGNGDSLSPALSGDGRFVVFVSRSANLVEGDTNGVEDVFVRDRQTGTTELASRNSTGQQGNGRSISPAITPDGRYVAFSSSANNLAGGSLPFYNIYLHDRLNGTTELVSRMTRLGYSSLSSLSSDGRFVAFDSTGILTAHSMKKPYNVFVLDRAAGTTQTISIDATGTPQGGTAPAISADGRHVAFQASNPLLAADTNGVSDIYVFDRQARLMERASTSCQGTQGSGASYRPAISADGLMVAFDSLAGNLVTGDINGTSDVFITDRRPLVADAGPDQAVEQTSPAGAVVTLDGSASRGGCGGEPGFLWTWGESSAEGPKPAATFPHGTTVTTLTVTSNELSASDTANITVRDTIPPATQANLQGEKGSGDWYRSEVAVRLDASDSGSGVRDIRYSIDGGEELVAGTAQPSPDLATSFVIRADAAHTIRYYAVDDAGNREEPNTIDIPVDKTPPMAAISISPRLLWPPNHKLVDVKIDGKGDDALSGVASIDVRIADEYGIYTASAKGFGGTVPLEAWREGTDRDGRHYTITAIVMDNAGNITTVTTEALVPHDMRGE